MDITPPSSEDERARVISWALRRSSPHAVGARRSAEMDASAHRTRSSSTSMGAASRTSSSSSRARPNDGRRQPPCRRPSRHPSRSPGRAEVRPPGPQDRRVCLSGGGGHPSDFPRPLPLSWCRPRKSVWARGLAESGDFYGSQTLNSPEIFLAPARIGSKSDASTLKPSPGHFTSRDGRSSRPPRATARLVRACASRARVDENPRASPRETRLGVD